MIRRIGKRGALTLPKALRVDAGLHPGMAVEVTAGNGGMEIKAAHKCCYFCGSPEDVYSVMNVNVCRACAKKLSEVIG